MGLKRTGAAVANASSAVAQPCGVIGMRRGRPDWRLLDQLIAKWQPDEILIGDPNTDAPELNKAINRIIAYVQGTHKMPVKRCDEAYTTDAANAEMASQKLTHAKKVELRDQIAACLMLEAYLSSL